MLPSLIGIIASSGGGVASSYESISTVTVGSGGAATVTFSSIPSTYQHLQIRCIAQAAHSGNDYDQFALRFNSDSGNNYSYHLVRGNGANAAAGSGVSGTKTYAVYNSLVSGSSSIFGASVIDLLDYKDTTKNKTIRSIGGADLNGSGGVAFGSGLWMNTSAITSIVLSNDNGNWNQYSSFALYGIKG
jgi:hypothetical protein